MGLYSRWYCKSQLYRVSFLFLLYFILHQNRQSYEYKKRGPVLQIYLYHAENFVLALILMKNIPHVNVTSSGTELSVPSNLTIMQWILASSSLKSKLPRFNLKFEAIRLFIVF
jgi:hypothetical protein